jgi:hypothetical protein
VLLLGPKGSGKSYAVRHALEWFTNIQREKFERENNYRKLRHLKYLADRDTTYWDSAANLAKRLNPRFSGKVGTRKKDKNEVRRELIETALTSNHVLTVFDECENCSPESLLFPRDLLSQSTEIALDRLGEGTDQSAQGLGVVLVGTPDIENVPAVREELGHRWSEVIRVRQITPEECPDLYEAWLPGFQEHIHEMGRQAWKNYISSLMRTAGNGLCLRLVKNHVHGYILDYTRKNAGTAALPHVKLDGGLFEHCWNKANLEDL